MKRYISMFLCVLLLTACQKAPDAGIGGEAWPEDWIRIGAALAVEPPGDGLTLLDYKDALAASGLYYAAWTAGDAEDYENADGETVPLYDAQLYLLMQDFRDDAAAAKAAQDWQSAEEASYEVTKTETITCAGQSFTMIRYAVRNERNPYAFGAAAFGTYRNHALSAELSCQAGFPGDPAAILTSFLNGIHYA